LTPDWRARCGTDYYAPEWVKCVSYALPKSGLRFFNYNISPGRWFEGNLTYIEPGVRICRIGVLCHEMGHFLGLPDYYDTDYSTVGLSIYSLMASRGLRPTLRMLVDAAMSKPCH
jgi:M6 family metalloprotease-like protein